MKRIFTTLLLGFAVAAALGASPASGAVRTAADTSSEPYCEQHPGVCLDTRVHTNIYGQYVGHDEPSVLFYSSRAGSGNSNTWQLQLPREAPVLPKQDGTGGTWNFQLHPAFWFGMALCETQSYPNPGKPCPADSDTNIKDDPNPNSPKWIGNHVGTGFLELQFYPPGWTPWVVGTSCDATHWCAAMATFGLSDSLTQTNNADCLGRAGEEFANFAFITKNGHPQGPPDPINSNFDTFNPNPAADLFMNAGDRLTISIHDTPAGLFTGIQDNTTGQSGFMTASTANGFAHPLFQPDASTCTEKPYALHPIYSTSSEHTRVPWAAHSYNVAFSDEIGHFEYCNQVEQGTCVVPGIDDESLDSDDQNCLPASVSLLAQVSGCLATDTDFDGESYKPDWPGTLASAAMDHQLHSESFVFTSPLSSGLNYERMAFEADLPAIEFAVGCNTDTGQGCVNPPPGASFYPIYSTRGSPNCAWQEGGTHIPGTTNTFGGTSTSEYGPLIALVYPPAFGFPQTTRAFEDFRNVLSSNPCPSTGQLP